MSSGRVQPENSFGARSFGSGNCEFDPVFNSVLFSLAHSPNVAGFDVMGEYFFIVVIDDDDFSVFRDLEGLIVGAVFLGFPGHQTDIRHVSTCGVVELPIFLAIFDDFIVDRGVASIRDQAPDFLEFILFVPHLAAISNDIRHGGIDDDV